MAFYIEATKKIKKFSLTAGLRFEDFKVTRKASTLTNEIKYNSSNFFPNLNALYELTPQIKISSSYSKKIQQPSYSTIDPNNGNNFNQYSSSTGNINLKPTFFDNFDFIISAFDYVNIGTNYTIGKDDNRFIFNANDNEFVSNQTTQAFDITFNRDFMNKKLKVGLHCFDVFNANEVNAKVAGQNLNTDFYQKRDSRNFRISLTYNFGNLKLESENTKIQTEKAKAGGGMMK